MITALEFDLHPVTELYAGALFFPLTRAAEVLSRWRDATWSMGEETTSLARLLRVPDAPIAPAHLRGQAFVIIEAVHAGALGDAEAALAPMRELGPTIDTFGPTTAETVARLHMDPDDPIAYLRGHRLLHGLTDEVISGVLDLAGPDAQTPLGSIELRHLGGAAARIPADHGALSAIPGNMLLVALGMGADISARDKIADALDRLMDRVHGDATPVRCANFAETRLPPSVFFDEPTLARLHDIKAQTDPRHVFVTSHDLLNDGALA